MRKWTLWMIIFLTWDPSPIEQSTWQIIWKEITERNFVAQGCKIFWRSHPDHWEQYQTQNCQDDQCGNKHALPVPIWTRMSNQLLKDKQKKCFIFYFNEIKLSIPMMLSIFKETNSVLNTVPQLNKNYLVLCILTMKLVLSTLFIGENNSFRHFIIFSGQTQ